MPRKRIFCSTLSFLARVWYFSVRLSLPITSSWVLFLSSGGKLARALMLRSTPLIRKLEPMVTRR